jgi:hypothetical protein
MDNARPSLELANFDKICPDKDIKGTSNSNSLEGRQAEGMRGFLQFL